MRLTVFAAVVFLLASVPGRAAVFNVTYSVSEICWGSAAGTINVTPLPCGFFVDPTDSVSAMTYDLIGLPSTNIVPGDLIIKDSTDFTSDVVRFLNTCPFGDGNACVVFYSDNLDSVDTPADVPGLPPNTLTNHATVTEVGPEGQNGFFYIPGANAPGALNGGGVVAYNLLSDGTPEPASILLMLGGAGALLIRKYRFQR